MISLLLLEMKLPGPLHVLEGLFVRLAIQMEDRPVEVHFLELEDILAVVAIHRNTLKLLLLLFSQRCVLWYAFLVRLQLVYDQLLLNLDSADIRDDLNRHRRLVLLDGQVLALLKHVNDLGDLLDAVLEDVHLLLDALLVWLVVFSLRESERSDGGQKLQQNFEIVSHKFLALRMVHAQLHLFEGELEVGQGAVATNSLEAGKWSRLDSVCVVEGFYCICVGPCCH